MLRDAGESADPWKEIHALAYLSALETNLGRPARGRELALRYLELAGSGDQDAQRAGALWPLAGAAGWLGRTDEALDAARQGLELAERTGHRLYVIGNLAAVGAVELSLDNPVASAAVLKQAWELMTAGGVESPGRFPLLPDLVEALAAVGEAESAAAVGREQRRIASRLDRPWIRALAARCEAVVADARGEEKMAVAAFERALREHGLQDRPLDRARTLLAYGTLHRRRRRKARARIARIRARVVRRGGRRAMGGALARGARADRRTPGRISGNPQRDRVRDREAGRDGPHQPRGRGLASSQRVHGGVEPFQALSQARGALAHRARPRARPGKPPDPARPPTATSTRSPPTGRCSPTTPRGSRRKPF